MKLTPITVTIDGKTTDLFVKKLKYREGMRLGGLLRKGMPMPEQDTGEDGSVLVNEKGEPVYKDVPFPLENIAEYQVELLRISLCNGAGKPFFTVDEIDDMKSEDIRDLTKQVTELNKTAEGAVEEARGNSAATGSEGSSSVSA